MHGKWQKDIESTDDSLSVKGHHVAFSDVAKPGDVPWEATGVDIVLECSGKMLTRETLEPYFERGVKKVIVAAPVKQGALNIVMGVNDRSLLSCDAPHRHRRLMHNKLSRSCSQGDPRRNRIRHGVITTIHDVTNTQMMVDPPHKDLRRARSALMSLIPTTTGSATAIGLIYPELQGKLNGVAIRVPSAQCFADGLCVRSRAGHNRCRSKSAHFKDAAEATLAWDSRV